MGTVSRKVVHIRIGGFLRYENLPGVAVAWVTATSTKMVPN
jgi:hypothetical protein